MEHTQLLELRVCDRTVFSQRVGILLTQESQTSIPFGFQEFNRLGVVTAYPEAHTQIGLVPISPVESVYSNVSVTRARTHPA